MYSPILTPKNILLDSSIYNKWLIRGQETLTRNKAVPWSLQSDIDNTIGDFALFTYSGMPVNTPTTVYDIRRVENAVIVGKKLNANEDTVVANRTKRLSWSAMDKVSSFVGINDITDISVNMKEKLPFTVRIGGTLHDEPRVIQFKASGNPSNPATAEVIFTDTGSGEIESGAKIDEEYTLSAFVKGSGRCRIVASDTHRGDWVELGGEWKQLRLTVVGGKKNLNFRLQFDKEGMYSVSGAEVYQNYKRTILKLENPRIDNAFLMNKGGFAISFKTEDSFTEHLSLTGFDPVIPNGCTVTEVEIIVEAANASRFTPPAYPTVCQLFNIGIRFKYSTMTNAVDGSVNTLLFAKPDGYSYSTKNIDKRYQYMVYRKNTFLGELADTTEPPTVLTSLNSFPSEVTLSLARNADSDFLETAGLDIVDNGKPEPIATELGDTIDTSGDVVKSFGKGTIIDVNNNIDIYEYYGNYEGFTLDDNEPLLLSTMDELEVPIGSPNGHLYFSGYISNYDVTYGENGYGKSKVTLLSHADTLNNIVLETEDRPFVDISGGNTEWIGPSNDVEWGQEGIYHIAQTFMFDSRQRLSSVSVKVKRNGAPVGSAAHYPTMIMDILKGNPDEDTIPIVSAVPAMIVDTEAYWQTFSLPADIILEPGQRYTVRFKPFVFEAFSGYKYSAKPEVEFFQESTYPNGVAWYSIGKKTKVDWWYAPVAEDLRWVQASGIDMQIRLLTRGGETSVPMFSIDPSTMFKKIIDYGRTRGSLVNYNSNSIAMTGTKVSAKFNLNTLKEAIDATINYCPSDWYWYIDQSTLTFHLNKRDDVVSHIFTLGKDIRDFKLKKSIEELVNEVYFTGGNVTESVATPFENLTYAGGSAANNRVTSQIFLPEPHVEYKISADYKGKNMQVAVYKFYDNSPTPESNTDFVESGKLTFRYDKPYDALLTGICVVAKADNDSAIAPSSTTMTMVSDFSVYRHLVDDSSQTMYRRALVKRSDQRVTNSVSADIIARSEVERNPEPIHVGTLSVIRDERPEHVSPGQLVGFRGFGNYIDELKLVIMEVELSRDIMTLSLGALMPKTSKRLEDLKRNLQALEQANNPNAPTNIGGI